MKLTSCISVTLVELDLSNLNHQSYSATGGIAQMPPVTFERNKPLTTRMDIVSRA
jgi:hypothetical protein